MIRSRLAGPGGSAFLAVAAAGLATQAITAVSGPLVARMLGPDGRGQMVLVTVAALMCCQLAGGGLPIAIAHTVARTGRSARDVVRPHLRAWARLWLLAALAAATAIAVMLHDSDAGGLPFGAVGFLLSAALIWQAVLAGMVQGEGDVRRINVYRLAGLALYTTCVVVMFVAVPSRDPLVLLGVFTACVGIGIGVGHAMLRPAVGDGDSDDATAMRQFARSGYLSGVGLLDGLGLDLLLVGAVLGNVKLGFYAVALSATNLSAVVLTGIAQILLPRLAAARTPQESAALVRRWVLASIVADITVVVALQAVLDPVIRFAFGAEFVPVIACARILIVSWALLGLRRVLMAVVQAQGRAGYTSMVETFSLGLLVAGVIVLGTLDGINGAALAMGITGVASCAALAVAVTWRAAPGGPAAPNSEVPQEASVAL